MTSTSASSCRPTGTGRRSRPSSWCARRAYRSRIYRTGVVVGDSRTGEIDRITGPYHLFGLLARLASFPSVMPVLLPDIGRINVVPVDYVAAALVELIHADGLDGQTFHLTAPESVGLRQIYRAVARDAGLPPLRGALPRQVAEPLLAVRGRATARPTRVKPSTMTRMATPGGIRYHQAPAVTAPCMNAVFSIVAPRDRGRVAQAQEGQRRLGRGSRSRRSACS